MKQRWIVLLFATVLAGTLAGCATRKPTETSKTDNSFAEDLRALQNKFAPDYHLGVYDVNFEPRGNEILLSGDVDSNEARVETVRAAERTGAKVTDKIRVLPDLEFGETNRAIICLSVANGREDTRHQAELGTQILMGDNVRVLKRSGRWVLVQSRDRYLSWVESGSLKLCREADVQAWEREPLLIVTSLEDMIRESPQTEAPPISDVVLGGRVKRVSETGDWLKVELPDGRSGYLPKTSVTQYGAWKNSRRATAESIENTGKQFIGRPYLWGANTPRGLDCSGFTKLTFFLNGIELNRNASHQAKQGVPVPLSDDLAHLKKGDLLFFGSEDRDGRRGRISHVGIYLGDKLFIQSSQRVRISSLDPNSPIVDRPRIRSLVSARRVLPE